jgi:hypothetical protein
MISVLQKYDISWIAFPSSAERAVSFHTINVMPRIAFFRHYGGQLTIIFRIEYRLPFRVCPRTGKRSKGRPMSDSGTKSRFYHAVKDAHMAHVIKVDLKAELFSYTIDEDKKALSGAAYEAHSGQEERVTNCIA